MAVRNRRLVAGALGGALGGLAMKAVVRYFDPNAFGLSSQTDAKAARALFGQDLEPRHAEQVGAAIHYVFGILTGVGYAAASERFPSLRTGRGTAFGGGLWLLGDELTVSATRLESPRAANARCHLSALAAHVVYGMIVDGLVSTSAQSRLPFRTRSRIFRAATKTLKTPAKSISAPGIGLSASGVRNTALVE